MNNETDFRKREIKTFVIRAGRMTATQEHDYTTYHSKWCIDFKDELLDYEKIFGNKNPVVIEIGFGMGKATAIIAAENPDINYIGLEVHRPGIGKLIGEIERRNLTNLRIIEYDAVEVLQKMIKDDSVSAFHVFFPDPWPKKKHHKRRLVQRPRTSMIAKKLIPGGYFYMATDWQPYAEFAMEELSLTEELKNAFEGFAPHQEWRPETRFEEKGKDAKRDIFELYFLRK